MKLLLVLFIICTSQNSIARNEGNSNNPNCESKNNLSSYGKQLLTLARVDYTGQLSQQSSSNRIKSFNNYVCGYITSLKREYTGSNSEEIMNKFKKELYKRMPSQFKQKNKSVNQQITTFWNTYSHQLNCDYGKKFGGQKHLLKAIIDYNISTPIYYDMILDLVEKHRFNINNVEIRNGQKETLYDYLLKIIAEKEDNPGKYNYIEIQDLADELYEEYGARKAAEIESVN